MQETQVQSLGQEDPLEKGMATRSSILAWRIPRTEEPGGLQSMGSQTVTHDLVRNTSNQKMCVSKDSLKHKSAASDSHMCTFQNNISIFSCSAGKTESKLSEAYGILSNFFIPIWWVFQTWHFCKFSAWTGQSSDNPCDLRGLKENFFSLQHLSGDHTVSFKN